MMYQRKLFNRAVLSTVAVALPPHSDESSCAIRLFSSSIFLCEVFVRSLLSQTDGLRLHLLSERTTCSNATIRVEPLYPVLTAGSTGHWQ
jgi:hypothetical protein